MSKILFGTRGFEDAMVEEGHEVTNGALRQVLTVQLGAKAASVDELCALLGEEVNTAQITVKADAGNISQMFEDYVLVLEVGVRLFNAGFDDAGNAVAANRIVIKLARRTALERQVAAMEAALKKAKLM